MTKLVFLHFSYLHYLITYEHYVLNGLYYLIICRRDNVLPVSPILVITDQNDF